MFTIQKITILNGHKEIIREYDGMCVASIDHFRIDLMAYLRRYDDRAMIEVLIDYKTEKLYE
jgi:hypothetical protein